MTAPVPQAAVDAAQDTLNAHEYRHSDLGRGWHCRCGGFFDNIGQHRAHVAAAVVAAVQGSIKAEARLDALATAIRIIDDGGDADSLRMWFHDLRADRIEAQP